MTVLAVDDLFRSFGGIRAVNGVTFDVAQAEIVGIIGPNGSGKSTLFNLLTGALKPDAGTISLFGKDITGLASHRIARAVHWLRTNYARPLSINELAAHVQMSASTLHHHFRLFTAMSPLQYQKWLRLNEARRLMLNEDSDAANAAFEVGYESPSQFSREYTRLFGAPPKRDIDGLRRKADVHPIADRLR